MLKLVGFHEVIRTRSSADTEKPARRVQRSVKVTKHGTTRIRYGFLLVSYSNFVPVRGTVFEIFDL